MSAEASPRSTKTPNAKLQQRIYNRAKRRAYNAVVHASPENERLFQQALVRFQQELESEVGYIPAPRGGRR